VGNVTESDYGLLLGLSQRPGKVKGTAVPVMTMKAYRGSRGIAPLILNLGTRRRQVVNFTSQLLYPLYPIGRILIPIE